MLVIMCSIVIILALCYIVANTRDKLEQEIHERFMILSQQIDNAVEELKQFKGKE